VNGITIASEIAHEGEVFLVCGSHFVVGEYLKEMNVL